MITVIMSVYNAEKYLKESIESVLNQTYTDFEFIIINDNSYDNSGKIIENYSKIDDRIKYIRNKKNKGLTYSLNKGIKLASGNFIARMDADDISHQERFKIQYDYLEKNQNVSVVGALAYNIDENGNVISERNVPLSYDEIIKAIPIINPIIHPSVMFRKKDIIDIGGYNENFGKVQDYELWFKCIANNLKVVNLTDRLLYYRINNQYLERKSFEYRLTDLKVRWNGYNLLSLPIYKRYGILIPITLGLIPNFILKKMYKFLKKYDPRNI